MSDTEDDTPETVQDDAAEAVSQLLELYPNAAPEELARRLRRRAALVRSIEPRYALQLEARAQSFQRRHTLAQHARAGR